MNPNRFRASSRGLRYRTLAGVCGMLALVLSGCATAPRGEDALVVERAQARWDAVVAGDLETAYAYYTPGYRSTHSVIDYALKVRTARVKWTSAEYLRHDCAEDRCTVVFSLDYRVAAPVPGMKVWDSKSTVEDTWVRTRGEWWYLPEK